MKNTIFVSLASVLILFSCTSKEEKKDQQDQQSVFTIAFGSCMHEDKPTPLLWDVVDHNPDVFIFLGDNIYGDTRNMDTLKAKYQRLAKKEEFQNLLSHTEVLATWDDHDYGENDAGRHYPFKEESKEIFLDFWDVPETSSRRHHTGIYDVFYKKAGDKTIQFILLDNRNFRDDLIHAQDEDTLLGFKNDYKPNPSSDSTILGEEQWIWLEKVFSEPADLRIICSSLQFSHEYNGWESWTNVPSEQEKFVRLIQETQANGVIFISGDVHWGEISKYQPEYAAYPIYDVTSSGLTQEWHNTEPNAHRIGPVIPDNNYGIIQYTPDKGALSLNIYDSSGVSSHHSLNISEISFD